MAKIYDTNKHMPRVTAMVGKTYTFNGSIHEETVTSVEENENEMHFIIQTTKNRRRVDAKGIDTFFRQMKEIKPKAELKAHNSGLAKTDKHPHILDQMEIELLDTISKLKANPGYVKQANAINSTVKTMMSLNMMKLRAFEATQRNNPNPSKKKKE